jgi:hypothetical protein
MLDIPDEGSDLEPDNEFPSDERLFRRYNKQGRNSRDATEQDFSVSKPFSVNREKYGDASYVLHPNCCNGQQLNNWGVWECYVRDIVEPTYEHPVTKQAGRFRVVHAPLELCKPHCNVGAFEQGSTELWKPSNVQKEAFKIQLARSMRRVSE